MDRRVTIRPSGDLSDDIADALANRITVIAVQAATAAANRVVPAIREELSRPAFARNLGEGIIIELRKPESQPIVQEIGASAGKSLANIPWIAGGAFLFGSVVGGAIVYLTYRSRKAK